MKYPEFLIGIANKIADTFGVRDNKKYACELSVQEKQIVVNVPVSAGATTGSTQFVISSDKKVLVTEIALDTNITKYSLNRVGSDTFIVKDGTGDIAQPFVAEENNSYNISIEVGTAPTSDTTYPVTISYLEIELIPIS